jgi:hypothetical protein
MSAKRRAAQYAAGKARPESDESIHALQPVATAEAAIKKAAKQSAAVPFDQWVKLYHLDSSQKPLFEVVFPRKWLESRDVFQYMLDKKIKAHNYGPDEETVVTYFESKQDAKELRNIVQFHWDPCHVSAGPQHRSNHPTTL